MPVDLRRMPSAQSDSLVIFDTGIVLQATLNPDGPAERAVQVVERGFATAIMNNRLRSEYEEVLTRPALAAKHPVLRQKDYTEGQLERIDNLFQRVENAPEHITFPRDPKDASIVNLAIHHQVDFIVSRDADLLQLKNDSVFQQLCPTTRIVDPVVFLQEIASVLPTRVMP